MWEPCNGYAQPHSVFLSLFFSQNVNFASKGDLVISQKYLSFAIAFTSIHWLKPAWSAKLTLLTSILLMVSPADDAGRAG